MMNSIRLRRKNCYDATSFDTFSPVVLILAIQLIMKITVQLFFSLPHFLTSSLLFYKLHQIVFFKEFIKVDKIEVFYRNTGFEFEQFLDLV